MKSKLVNARPGRKNALDVRDRARVLQEKFSSPNDVFVEILILNGSRDLVIQISFIDHSSTVSRF